jgi:DNA-binding XRE family transcriptional regulator
MPDGSRIKMHPFLWLLKHHGYLIDDNRAELARRLGVSVQSVYKWERQCAADRNFPLPILRAGQIAEIFKVPAALLRPTSPGAIE